MNIRILKPGEQYTPGPGSIVLRLADPAARTLAQIRGQRRVPAAPVQRAGPPPTPTLPVKPVVHFDPRQGAFVAKSVIDVAAIANRSLAAIEEKLARGRRRRS